MKNTIFRGMATAIVTPMTADGIDYEALERLIEFQIEKGINAIVVMGTTGENATIEHEEQTQVIKLVVDKVNKRVPVIAGTGSNDAAYAIELTKYACSIGYDAMLLVTPYYNKATQNGLIAHFTAVADASTVPVIMYNVPGRTGVNMTPELTLRLAKDFPDKLVAIKEASGNLAQMETIIKDKPADFLVISGDDGLAFPLITLGGAGVISVIGNAFPYEFGRMVRLTLAGDYDNARAIHHQFLDLFNLLFVDGNPAGVKSMLNAMGYIENKLRLPLVPKINLTLTQCWIMCVWFMN